MVNERSEQLTLGDVRRYVIKEFKKAGIAAAEYEATLLIEHVFALTRVEQFTRSDAPVKPEQLSVLKILVSDRQNKIPLAYLTGKVVFAGFDFLVGPGVLIPRPDSEILVEQAGQILGNLYQNRPAGATADIRLLDTFCGSGCVGIAILRQSLAVERPLALHLADCEQTALEFSQKNIRQSRLEQYATTHLADIFPVAQEPFDLITANPPYIESAILPTLMAEVKHEPRMALDGGSDGLYFIRRLIQAAPGHLKRGGWLLIEHGHDQAKAVSAILKSSGFKDISAVADYNGTLRVAAGRL